MSDASTPDSALAALLRPARRILIFTGAGISTSSGIPDYRGPQGIWKSRPPVYYDDFMSSEAARIEYWDFKLESWDRYKTVRPNAVHLAIVRLEQAARIQAVVTQNVDGLHALAGTSPDRLVEIHGTDRAIECQSCGERTPPDAHFEAFRASRRPPLCRCGGILKPATISFGQGLRPGDLRRAQTAANSADLVVALGSTLSVHPAASIPLAAAARGIPYVVINSGATEHDHLPQVTLRIDADVTRSFPPAVDAALGAA